MTTAGLLQQSTLPLWDLDATQAASYGGAGVTFHNLVANPADGLAQSAYDFTAIGAPVFTGAAGDPAAYWAMNGPGYFQIAGGNTETLKNISKLSTDAMLFDTITIIIAFRTNATPTIDVDLWGTQGGVGGGLSNVGRCLSYSTDTIPSSIGGPAILTKQFIAGFPDAMFGCNFPWSGGPWVPPTITANTDYLIAMALGYEQFPGSYPPNEPGYQCALNTRLLSEDSGYNSSFDVTQDDPTATFCFGSAGNGTPMANGYRVYGCYGFGKLLTDDEYSAFVNVLNARQGNRWAF